MIYRIPIDGSTLTRVRAASIMVTGLFWLACMIHPGVIITLLAVSSLMIPVIPFRMTAVDEETPVTETPVPVTHAPVTPIAKATATADTDVADPLAGDKGPDVPDYPDADHPDEGDVLVVGPADLADSVDVDNAPEELLWDDDASFVDVGEFAPSDEYYDVDGPEVAPDDPEAIEETVPEEPANEEVDAGAAVEEEGPVAEVTEVPVAEVPFPDPTPAELAENTADDAEDDEAIMVVDDADAAEALADESLDALPELDEGFDAETPELADRPIEVLADLEQVLGLDEAMVEGLVTEYGDEVMDAIAIDPRRVLSGAGLHGSALQAAVDRYTNNRTGLPFAVANFGELTAGDEAAPVKPRRRGENFVCVVEVQLKDGPPFLLAGFGISSNLAFQNTMEGLTDYLASGYSLNALRIGDNAGAVEAVYLKAVSDRKAEAALV